VGKWALVWDGAPSYRLVECSFVDVGKWALDWGFG
jgi:hypothetical protein